MSGVGRGAYSIPGLARFTFDFVYSVTTGEPCNPFIYQINADRFDTGNRAKGRFEARSAVGSIHVRYQELEFIVIHLCPLANVLDGNVE